MDTTSNPTAISVSEEGFKKAAKKLLAFALDRQAQSEPTTLAQAQEALSKCLGFRSLHGALAHLHGSKTLASEVAATATPPHAPPSTRAWSSPLEFGSLAISLMGNHDSMWHGRAVVLVETVAEAIAVLHAQGETEFTSETFNAHLEITELLKLNKRRDLLASLSSQIENYLRSLSGFEPNAPRQSDTTKEQHGYLQMQALSPIKKLAMVERDDFILLDASWLPKGGATFPTLRHELMEIDYIEHSWFSNEAFIAIAQRRIEHRKQPSISLSDLIQAKSRMIHSELEADLSKLLMDIFSNFHSAKALSEKIQKTAQALA